MTKFCCASQFFYFSQNLCGKLRSEFLWAFAIVVGEFATKIGKVFKPGGKSHFSNIHCSRRKEYFRLVQAQGFEVFGNGSMAYRLK